MVGALIFEAGILARTQDGMFTPDTGGHAAAYLPLPAGVGVSGHDPEARAPQSQGGHTPDVAGTRPSDAVPVPITIRQDPPLLDNISAADLYHPASQPAPAKASVEKPPAKPSVPKPPTSRPATPATPPPARAAWNVAPIVTWYGPGFYGNRTACGQRYTRTIIGVAHKTLPCGTLIQFRWQGITAMARVIDRGPYATSDYVFDFSAALACDVFKPRGAKTGCFTRHNVEWRVIGRRQN